MSSTKALGSGEKEPLPLCLPPVGQGPGGGVQRGNSALSGPNDGVCSDAGGTGRPSLTAADPGQLWKADQEAPEA